MGSVRIAHLPVEAGQFCRPLAWLKVLLGRPVLVAGLAPIS